VIVQNKSSCEYNCGIPSCGKPQSSVDNIRIYMGSEVYCFSYCVLEHFKSHSEGPIIQKQLQQEFDMTFNKTIQWTSTRMDCAAGRTCKNKTCSGFLFITCGRSKRMKTKPPLQKKFLCSIPCLMHYCGSVTQTDWKNIKKGKKDDTSNININNL